MCGRIWIKAKKRIAEITLYGYVEVCLGSRSHIVKLLPYEEDYKESNEFTENIDVLTNNMI